MKFAHDLKMLEADAPEALRGHFIAYKQLKKLLKTLPAAEDRSEAEQEFFTRLRKEVQAVNRLFEKHAVEVLRAASARRARRRAAQSCCLAFLHRRGGRGTQEEELLAQARWCRRFAKVNAAGLRKIAKKHDKRAANDAGQRFLQACWDCRNTELGAFLHSPLMAELKALEELRKPGAVAPVSGTTSSAASALGSGRSSLSAPRGAAVGSAAAAAVSARSSWHSGRQPKTLDGAQAGPSAAQASGVGCADSGSFAASALELEDISTGSSVPSVPANNNDKALICTICLEPMYKPLGLGCGHKFCTECVMEAIQGGHADLLQPLRRMLAAVPPSAACPECRQRAVFHNAVELQKLGAFIYTKYPDEITERAAALAEKLAALKLAKVQQQRSELHSRMDRYFQPFGYGI